MELDRIDRKILDVLQGDNQITNLALAERVAVSPPSCLRRVRRLREEGVIVADVSIVDPRALGRGVTAIVQVHLNDERLDLRDGFARAMRRRAEVTQCYLVTGDPDFVLIVQVSDMAAFEEFTRAALYADTNVRKFTTFVTLDRIKFETRIPTDER